jgi:peptidoglycan/LPS O-acetylase OafA/YrhL
MKDYKLSEGSSIILDLIRGLSAQIVVIGHGITFFGIFTFLQEPKFPNIHYIAVLIFFLLSGFLISYSTVRKKNFDTNYGFKHYFIDRFSRIYTSFIPAIIFVFLIDFVSKSINPELYLEDSTFDLKTFIGNIFMLQDYSIFSLIPYKFVHCFGTAKPFWTLAIEWWIYLSFGYLLLVILRKKKISLLNLLLFSFFSIVPVFNLIMGRGNGLTTYWLFGSLVYLISSLNLLNEVRKNIKLILILFFSGLGFLRAYLKMEAYDPIFAFFLAITLWLVIDYFKDQKLSSVAIKIIKYNASFSYTLYLIHYSILSFIKTHFDVSLNPYILFIIGFIISNIVSILIGRYTELSLTKKVQHYLYKKIEVKSV